VRAVRFSISLLFILTSGLVSGAPNTARIDAGTVYLNVPEPDGFLESSDIDMVNSFANSLIIPGNVLLGIYIEEEDVAKIIGFQEPKLDRYMLLQSDRRIKQDRLSKQYFREMADSFKKYHGKLFSNIKDDVNKHINSVTEDLGGKYNVPFEMALGKTVSLGTSYNKEEAIGVTTLTRYETNIGGHIETFVMVGGVNIIYLKGKILYAYVYSTFNSRKDIEWNRAISKYWVDAILSANRF